MATLLKCEQVLDSLEMAKPVSMSTCITITHGSWPVHLLVIISFIGFHYFDLSSNGVSSKLKLIHIES